MPASAHLLPRCSRGTNCLHPPCRDFVPLLFCQVLVPRLLLFDGFLHVLSHDFLRSSLSTLRCGHLAFIGWLDSTVPRPPLPSSISTLTAVGGAPWLEQQLRALQRPVAALQLYIRLVAAAGGREEGRRASAEGSGGGGGALGGSSTHSQQQLQQQQRQKQQKRAAREASLMLTFEDLCWRYPDAARVAAR